MLQLQQRSAGRWAAQASHLTWRTWDDDEFLVYHTPSGATHLLNEVAAEVLRALECAALDNDEAAERVGARLNVLPDEIFSHHIEKLLAQFDELGLIEPVL